MLIKRPLLVAVPVLGVTTAAPDDRGRERGVELGRLLVPLALVRRVIGDGVRRVRDPADTGTLRVAVFTPAGGASRRAGRTSPGFSLWEILMSVMPEYFIRLA